MDRPAQGNWNAGMLEIGAFSATVEMVLATKGDPIYTAKLKELLPRIKEYFGWLGGTAARAIPYMDEDYRAQLAAMVREAKPQLDAMLAKSPFGVPISERTWAGGPEVVMFGFNAYLLHKAFPEIVGKEYVLDALDYILGRHPANNPRLPAAGVRTWPDKAPPDAVTVHAITGRSGCAARMAASSATARCCHRARSACVIQPPVTMTLPSR